MTRQFATSLADKVELTEMFQVYGGAPQYLGFFLEAGKWGANPQWGKVLVSSALAPVPILGKPFRDNSGTAIYNRLIYGMLDSEDQIAPFQGEAFLDFHLAGVLAGFCLLGWIAFKLQAAFARAKSFVRNLHLAILRRLDLLSDSWKLVCRQPDLHILVLAVLSVLSLSALVPSAEPTVSTWSSRNKIAPFSRQLGIQAK